MHPSWRPTKRDWLDALVFGAIVGAIILGVGGRIAMRGIAHDMGQPGGFTWGGTLTVVFMGAVYGVVGAVALVVGRSMHTLPRFARGAIYWGVLLGLPLLPAFGLPPVTAQKVGWFLPPVLAYGVILQYATCRAATRRRVPDFATASIETLAGQR